MRNINIYGMVLQVSRRDLRRAYTPLYLHFTTTLLLHIPKSSPCFHRTGAMAQWSSGVPSAHAALCTGSILGKADLWMP